jgi:hypothetical protein
LWRHTLSVGWVLGTTAWIGSVALIGLGWLLDIIYLGHLGMTSAALGGTLTLSHEHQRTRRYVRALCMTEPPDDKLPVPAQRSVSTIPTLSNLGRIRAD